MKRLMVVAILALSISNVVMGAVVKDEKETVVERLVMPAAQQAGLSDTVLLSIAKEAMDNAYAPYSNFHVGAALLSESGKIYSGCNVENASYGATLCAERVAMVKAVSAGERKFCAIAIVSSGGDFTYPCGMCRQFLAEFGLDMRVVVQNDKGEIRVHILSDLLPHAFTGASLQDPTETQEIQEAGSIKN